MRLTISVPDELGEAVQAQAARERRSLSNLVALFIERGLDDGASVAAHLPRPNPRVPFRGPDPKVK